MTWTTTPDNGITLQLPSGTPVRLGIVWDANRMRDVAYIVPGYGDDSGEAHAAMISAVPELLAVAHAVANGRFVPADAALAALAKAGVDSEKIFFKG